jgi:hypothetical protein
MDSFMAVTDSYYTVGAGGVSGAVDIAGATKVMADTVGDNGGIYVDTNSSSPTSVYSHTLGEDADIIWNHTGGTLELDYVATQNGDIVVHSDGDVVAGHVWALDGGMIDPNSAGSSRPILSDSGISQLPETNGITGDVDDAHFIWISTSEGARVTAEDAMADYYVRIDTEGAGGHIRLGTLGIQSGEHVELNAAAGNIIDADNSDNLNIRALGDITLRTGGFIGEVGGIGGDPLEVAAAGAVNVGALSNSAYFYGVGSDAVWAFLNGDSGSGEITFLGPGQTAPGMIVWNGVYTGGPAGPMHNVWRHSLLQAYEMPLHTSGLLDEALFYFPHSYMSLPDYPAYLPIELILNGGAPIEGLPEGLEPAEINVNEIDDTMSWDLSDEEEMEEGEVIQR